MIVLNRSITLVGSLSREVYSIRIRCDGILSSILNTKDEDLIDRLKNELKILENRRKEVFSIATSMRKFHYLDNLSIELLIEIASRPLNYYPNAV